MNILLFLGLFVFVFGFLLVLVGRYAEGTAKLINMGNKLVRNELKPQEFINEYQKIKNTPDLVINKPSVDVLQLLALAYDSLNDKESCLCVVDEMIAVASKKKKTFAKLIKASVLYSYDMIDEAEEIFNECRSSKNTLMCQALADTIMKSDRAMAVGDYKTVELYNLSLLERTFPKLDNLNKLIVHFKLAEVYDKMQEFEKAIPHYKYCVENSGETSFGSSGKSALENLQ